jgi:predicted amidophosphoribosyltransferase
MNAQERGAQIAGPSQASGIRACPFCGAPAPGQFCPACRRDTTWARRPCPRCGRMVPSLEQTCWSCGAHFRSELWWKVPLIILLFLITFVISILLALLK